MAGGSGGRTPPTSTSPRATRRGPRTRPPGAPRTAAGVLFKRAAQARLHEAGAAAGDNAQRSHGVEAARRASVCASATASRSPTRAPISSAASTRRTTASGATSRARTRARAACRRRRPSPARCRSRSRRSTCRSPAARWRSGSPSSTSCAPRACRSARSRWSASTIRWSPATGHRICNDCMKSCIYQKQEPVDIPQSETRLLKDVLALPWGFEIYSLLTRWNPLNLRRPVPVRAHRQAGAGRRHGARRLHARPSPGQRRPHRGRRRRPQDRAARPGAVRHHDRAASACRSRRSRRRRRCSSRSTTA